MGKYSLGYTTRIHVYTVIQSNTPKREVVVILTQE